MDYPKNKSWREDEALEKIKLNASIVQAEVMEDNAIQMASLKEQHQARNQEEDVVARLIESNKKWSQTRETENFKRVGDFVFGKSFKIAFAVSSVRSFYARTDDSLLIYLGDGAELHGSGTVEELLEILK